MKRKLEIGMLCTGWGTITLQFILMLQNRQADITETIIRFFSFFTILTNILVALFFTTTVFQIKKPPFKILLTNGAISAITAFILIVGLVYQVVLRNIWEPTGLQAIVDELLHTIIPLLMLIYWFFNVREDDLKLKSVLKWLLYPFTYIILILGRGYISGYYPYPFLNIAEIGAEKSMINITIIFVLAIIILVVLSQFGKYLFKYKGTTD